VALASLTELVRLKLNLPALLPSLPGMAMSIAASSPGSRLSLRPPVHLDSTIQARMRRSVSALVEVFESMLASLAELVPVAVASWSILA